MTPDTALKTLRDQAPLVHCITNYVAMNIAANTLLAAGASPAMLHAEAEVADFVPLTGALTINIGTLSPPWVTAMKKAADTAQHSTIPWVLDPVAHFATPYRAKVAQDLLARCPTIIRGNASEIIALAGGTSAGKGADSGDNVEDAQRAAHDLAIRTGSVIAVSGPVDFVTDGNQAAHITGGSALMPKVTALGCSLTCLMGAFAAVAPPMDATVAALCLFAKAGEQAEALAAGPGTFTPHFLDALAAITPAELSGARATWA